MENWKNWLAGGLGFGGGITVIGGIFAAIIHGSIWYADVNSDREDFRSFMTEVRTDIKKILFHLEGRKRVSVE